jgi:foldase protein PrsA
LVKWLAVCALLLASMALIGCGGGLPGGAIAKVGQAVVTSDQYNKLESGYKAAGREPDKNKQRAAYNSFREGLAQYLVSVEVMKQRASTVGVTVTDDDVQRQIDVIKGMFGNDQKRFDEALKKENITLDQLTESIRDQLWVERMKAAVTKGVSVTDTEAKAYYESHKSDYVQPEERRTSHILISPSPSASGTDVSNATQEDWDQALAEAQKIRAQIQNNSDFSAQAAQYSDDATTKDSGGDLGLITRGEMPAAFEEAVFSLKKNQVSQPVKTQYGYHLIVVTDIIPSVQLSYDAASEKIKSTLLEQKQNQVWSNWLEAQERALGVEYGAGFKPPAGAASPVTLDMLGLTDQTTKGQ